jgi:ferrous iron transport protein B
MSVQTSLVTPLITLAGPPNSGKTTLFNLLSGKKHKTVNYPGSTVDYSTSRMQDKYGIRVNLLDSPGIVSLLPASPDEEVSVEAIYNHPELGTPDLVITTIDASQVSRHLLLTKQLIASGFDIIVVLTMTDLLQKKGFLIDELRLSEYLNCPVVKVDGRTGKGILDLVSLIEQKLNFNGNNKLIPVKWNGSDKNKIFDLYNEIEQIEKNVILESPGSAHCFDLNAVNRQLVILDDNVPGRNKHKPDQRTLNIDRYLLHRVWGILFFFLIMSATFTSIFWIAEPIMNLIDEAFAWLASGSTLLFGNSWLGDLVSNGIINGTGSVLVFLPQILILFLILGLLEDTGYLSRGAMLIDKPLSKIGLNGKSFVPMLSGFACAIPAMMASRTIPNKRERLLTIFILPLMSCSARLPVYALLIAFLVPVEKQWLGGVVLASIYIFGIFSSVVIAGFINKFKHKLIKEDDNSSFILELPAYRIPKLKVVLYNTYSNAKLYLQKAGPLILGFSMIIWFLTYFPNTSPEIETKGKTQDEITQAQDAERLATSYASGLGKLIQPVMTPLGMDWRVGVSLISAFAAREVFVSSLALIFKVTSDDENIQQSILEAMRTAEVEGTGEKLFTTATITGLIVFFIFALQCISTLAVSRKETGGWRIPLLQLTIFTSLAYIFAFITVNGLRAFGIG